MNVGDKICCKRDFITNSYYFQPEEMDRIHFIKDKYYKIIGENSKQFILISELSSNCHLGKEDVEHMFYSTQELRKLKLEKLNVKSR